MRALGVGWLRAVAGLLRGVPAYRGGRWSGLADGWMVSRRGVVCGHRRELGAALGAIAAAVLVLLGAQPALGAPPSVSFTAALNVAVGADPFAVAVGDFNGDGNPDLAVANNGSNNVSVLRGMGPVGLAPRATSRPTSSPSR